MAIWRMLGAAAVAAEFTPYPYVWIQSPVPDDAVLPSRSKVSPQPEIILGLAEAGTSIQTNTLELALDGEAVEPEIHVAGPLVTVVYTPEELLTPSTRHEVRATFLDDASPPVCYEVAWEFAVGPYVLLEPGMAGPPGSASVPGFRVRTVQAPVDVPVANSLERALLQLTGLLAGSDGGPVPNEALPGPNPDGSWSVEGKLEFYSAGETEPTPYGFPGIPGTGGHDTRFAAEAIAFLELPAGPHVLRVSVAAALTDEMDDDGFALWANANPRDVLGIEIGRYSRTVPGIDPTVNTNDFMVFAPAEGVYPFRMVYYQTTRNAYWLWQSEDPDTGEWVFINDLSDPRALRAFQTSTHPPASGPAIIDARPGPRSGGVDPGAPLIVLWEDGERALNEASIELRINGQAQPAAVSRTGVRVTLDHKPSGGWPAGTNLIELLYCEAGMPLSDPIRRSWVFVVAPPAPLQCPVRGQWDFEAGDLRATVGLPLEYLDGAGGETALRTRFGATAELEVPDIGGEPARVMLVPGHPSNLIGYVMRHGLAANGGGQRVNQFTIAMDVYWMPTDKLFGAMVNYDLLNLSDGDFFYRAVDGGFGQGKEGYEGVTRMEMGRWHRVAWAVDMSRKPPLTTKYLDGIKHADLLEPDKGPDDPRRSMPIEGIVLFGDGDADERMALCVNSIQVREGKLPDAALERLGPPTASGIPRFLPGFDPGPWIDVRRIPGGIELAWEPFDMDWVLEESSTGEAGTWEPVEPAEDGRALVAIQSPMRFYRLRLP
ncbi:MAG: hypothetical protein KA118_14670 [Verrucomicrobia bacterium]|nr:hypothetical protein [Verrucomicrobiota bacterium]